MADRWALSGPAGEAPTFKPPSSLLQESEDVSSVLLRLFEGRPVAAILEEKHSRVGEVVEDVDAFLERDHAVVAAVDQEGRGLGWRWRLLCNRRRPFWTLRGPPLAPVTGYASGGGSRPARR